MQQQSLILDVSSLGQQELISETRSIMTLEHIIPICLPRHCWQNINPVDQKLNEYLKTLQCRPRKVLTILFSNFLQSLFNVYLMWNISTLRANEADRWRDEPRFCILFVHLSDSLTRVWGGLQQQSEVLVTHHSLTDGFTLNWGSMRSVSKTKTEPAAEAGLHMHAQTTQCTAPVIFSPLRTSVLF